MNSQEFISMILITIIFLLYLFFRYSILYKNPKDLNILWSIVSQICLFFFICISVNICLNINFLKSDFLFFSSIVGFIYIFFLLGESILFLILRRSFPVILSDLFSIILILVISCEMLENSDFTIFKSI